MLPVEEFSHGESMGYGVILVKLMQQECLIMIIHKVDLSISILPRLHIMQDIVRYRYLRNENLRALTHHEHWEVVVSLIMRLHVSKNSTE